MTTAIAASKKKLVPKVYQDGEKLLFVPLVWMWTLHDASKASPTASLRGKIRAGRALSESKTRGLSLPNVEMYLHRFEHLEWFRPWLIEGADAPPAVTIPNVEQLRAAFDAWHYTELVRECGISVIVVNQWYRYRAFPDDDAWGWHAWLWGKEGEDEHPKGWLVINERMEALRYESTVEGISAAAVAGDATYGRWQRDSKLKALLQRVIENKAASPKGDVEWDKTDARTRNAMIRYARAAAPWRCRQRAKAAGYYDAWMADARKCGGEDLVRYLTAFLDGKTDPVKTGVLHQHLYRPRRAMLTFRRRAANRMRKVWPWLEKLPAWRDWMHECTAPRPRRGKRSTGAPSQSKPAITGAPPSNGDMPIQFPRVSRKLDAAGVERDKQIIKEWSTGKYEKQAALVPWAVAKGWSRDDVYNAFRREKKARRKAASRA